MAKTYAKIQKQIESLQREADKMKRAEVDGFIARIREAINVYGLTAVDLGLRGKPGRKPREEGAAAPAKKPRKGRTARAAKFRDDAGNTWGGRGPRPQWLRDALAAGKSLQDFAV